MLCCAAAALAQVPPAPAPFEQRPSDTRPLLPPFREPQPSPFALPPAPIPPVEPGRLVPGLRVFVKRVVITGNKVIPAAELAGITKEYENRIVTSEDLQELRNKLTLAYIKKGYLNSGALLPDQQVKDGVVRFEIIEGKLSQIEITGNQQLKSGYIIDRILLGAGPPLNGNKLQERLQILQQDGLIERINAELSPGTRPGEAVLKANVEEALPYQVGLAFSNRRPPSVGPYLGEIFASNRNLTGRGDTFDIRYGLTHGVDDYQIGYALPLNARDTTLSLRVTETDSQVLETPFDQINIQSRARTYQAGLTQPVWRTINQSISLGLRYEYRENQTSLLGIPFSFTPGVPDGHSQVNVIRFSQDWVRRSPEDALALRSTFSNGWTNAGPQMASIGPSRHFFSWLGQVQWAKRLYKNNQLVVRTDVQYTPNSLMSLEQIALGGMNTVRGYRENQLLRDNGVIASVEYRIPITDGEPGKGRFQLAPFIDYGNSWNSDATPASPHSIAGYGLGFLWDYGRQFQSQLYVARATRHFLQNSYDLQDSGIHFALSYLLF